MKGKYVTQNSVDFVSKMKDVKIKRNHTMISFDVVFLFTKVPIQVTLGFMKSKLIEDISRKRHTQLELQDVIMLTELCLQGNFFSFKGDIYEQMEEAAMSSPISPIFAEFFMQNLEVTIIPTSGHSLYSWWRYVDEVFSIAKSKDVDVILTALNNFNPSINFTYELMENNELSFLDTRITIKNNFSLSFSVYRKKTHTDRYLHFTSNHPMHHKISVIDALVTRAIRICDTDQLDSELNHIKMALKKNGYPIQSICSKIEYHSHNQNLPRQPKDEFVKRIVLPYTGRMASQIA